MTKTPMPDGWGGAAAYERYMGRWSRPLAPRLLRWLDLPPGRRWLDVGCGTGALSEAILATCAPRALCAVDPSDGFLAAARKALPPQVTWHRAGAERLPLADDTVDATASLLVLNFVGDTALALREMARVTVAGGTVAACVWDYAQRMDLIRHYWDAASALGLLAPGQDQGERFPICRPDALTEAFSGAGLVEVDVCALEIEMHFTDFDDYWRPFLGGQGSAPAHAVRLDEAQRERLRLHLRDRLPIAGDGSIRLAARAWAARGTVIA